MTKRKVIQLQGTADCLLLLCDDGSVWQRRWMVMGSAADPATYEVVRVDLSQLDTEEVTP